LKPEDSDGAEQTEESSKLELPLPNDPAFLGKKDQREKRGHDHRRPDENRIHAGAHVVKGEHLGDLMNNVRQGRRQTNAENAEIQSWFVATKPRHGKRQNGNERDRVAVKILRERIVIAVEVKLEK